MSQSITARVAWGAYDCPFSLRDGESLSLVGEVEPRADVTVELFDDKRYETRHPVRVVCAAAAKFQIPDGLESAFDNLAKGQLPPGSRTRDEVTNAARTTGVSCSFPIDQYPSDLDDFLVDIYRQLNATALRCWRLLRWRVGAETPTNSFPTVLESVWSWEGKDTKFPLAQRITMTVESRALPMLTGDVQLSVQAMLDEGVFEPASQELLQEARSLKGSNPRAALLLAVAAIEVGVKELVGNLVPRVEWMTFNLPSPDIPRILKNAFPQLGMKQGTGEEIPTSARTTVIRAIEARNGLAHRAMFPGPADVDEIVDVADQLLQQFAYYRGIDWATPPWK